MYDRYHNSKESFIKSLLKHNHKAPKDIDFEFINVHGIQEIIYCITNYKMIKKHMISHYKNYEDNLKKYHSSNLKMFIENPKLAIILENNGIVVSSNKGYLQNKAYYNLRRKISMIHLSIIRRSSSTTKNLSKLGMYFV